MCLHLCCRQTPVLPFLSWLYYSKNMSTLINEFSCGIRSTRSKIHISLMNSRGGLMLTRLRSVMRLALRSSRLGVSRDVTGSSSLASVSPGVFRRGHGTTRRYRNVNNNWLSLTGLLGDRRSGHRIASVWRLIINKGHQFVGWPHVVVGWPPRCRTVVPTHVYTHPDSVLRPGNFICKVCPTLNSFSGIECVRVVTSSVFLLSFFDSVADMSP